MNRLHRDLTFAWRMLRKQPGMSLAAILCLALGIGATTVIYSLVDGVLLAPLPYRQPDDLFALQLSFPAAGVERAPASGKEFEDLRAETQVFAETGGIIGWNFNLTSLDPPQRLRGGRLSASVFRILGVPPALGRLYTDAEERDGAQVVVLSHGLWQRAFGADPGIIGRQLALSQVPYEVIGVMPEGYLPLPAETELWVPLVLNPQVPRDLRGVNVVARLAEGVDSELARTALDQLEQRFRQDHPGIYPDSGWGLSIDPLRSMLIARDVERQLMAFSGAVFLVLLIACANVANLLLTQATRREKEIALRSTFGASRLRLIQQLLTESTLLAVFGGIGGIVLAYLGLRAVLALDLGDIPRLDQVGLDPSVLGFTLLITLATALACGLMPALRLSRSAFSQALGEGGRANLARAGHPLRSALVVLELALAGIVLIASALMLRSLGNLQRVDPGFRTDDRVTMRIFLPNPAYAPAEARVDLYQRLRTRLAALPGIEDAELSTVLPLSGFRNLGQALREDQSAEESWPPVGWTMVSPGYFELLEVPLIEGRVFSEADRADSHPVVVIDQAVAQRLWPDRSPIGQRLQVVGPPGDGWREVIGVVGTIRQLHLTDTTEQLYLPFPQHPGRYLHPLLRTSGEPAAAAAMVRDVLRDIDPNLPIGDIDTLERLASGQLAGPRFNLTVFALFGAAAFLLAGIGTYGVLAYSAAQRRAEIGVRRALGARRRDVLRVILGRGMTLAGLGVLLGLAGGWLLSTVGARHLADLLYDVPLTDLPSFAGVGALLLATALLANLVPAVRAARVDPMQALRQE
ncbi:MAG: ABC transporter permease [Acidobacteriota bacterium]